MIRATTNRIIALVHNTAIRIPLLHSTTPLEPQSILPGPLGHNSATIHHTCLRLLTSSLQSSTRNPTCPWHPLLATALLGSEINIPGTMGPCHTTIYHISGCPSIHEDTRETSHYPT
jgi:hypothetical protein